MDSTSDLPDVQDFVFWSNVQFLQFAILIQYAMFPVLVLRKEGEADQPLVFIKDPAAIERIPRH